MKESGCCDRFCSASIRRPSDKITYLTRPVLLLRLRPAADCDADHAPHQPVALWVAPAGHSRQSAEGRVSLGARQALSLCSVSHTPRCLEPLGSSHQRSNGTGLSGLANWVQSGNLRLHAAARRIHQFFRTFDRRHVFVFLQDQIMSLTEYWRSFRRHPGADRHLLSARHHGRSGQARVVVGVTLLEADNVTEALRRILRTRRREFCDQRWRARIYHRTQRRRKNNPGQYPDGFVRPTAGNVTFKGTQCRHLGPVHLARLGMARSFQLVNIFPELSVGETIAVAAVSYLRLGGRIFSSTARRSRRVGNCRGDRRYFWPFTSKLDDRERSLSQGDKKLIDVASAFALRPEIILIDEPTAA